MVVAHHVDEVHDNDAAQVAQAQLAGDGLRGFQVGAEHRVVEIACTHIAAGVHVDRGQGLGLVDHQIATGLEVHATAQRTCNVLVDVVEVEHRPLAAVVRDAVQRAGHVLAGKSLEQAVLFFGVHLNGLGLGTDQVAQHALHEREVLVQQRARRLAGGRGLDVRPGLAQVGNVFRQLLVGGVFGVGPQDEPAAPFGRERHQPLAQGLALGVRDFLRHADVLVLGQEHQQAPSDADLRREPRALAADRVLEHLYHQRLTLEDLPLDGQYRRRGGGGRAHRGRTVCRRLATRHQWRLVLARMAGGDVGQEIGHVQEGGPVQPHVDERRLHAGQHARDLAQVDVAHQPTLQGAFDVHFLHGALLHHRHTGFLRGPVDEDVLCHGAITADADRRRAAPAPSRRRAAP